jgi:hypothetical protein
VAARSVPVSKKLRGKRNRDAEIFSDSTEQVASHGEVVSDLDTFTGTNLEFPLARHDLTVGARNVYTSVKADSVVSVSNGATEAEVGTDWAVVGTLLAGETILGPAEGLEGELGALSNESVFLLDSVPRLLFFNGGGIPNLLSKVSKVSVGRDEFLEVTSLLPVPGLAQDHDVVSTAEGVRVECDGLKDDFWVFSDSLVGAASVIVPLRDLSKGSNLAFESSALSAELNARSIDPDVFSNDLALLGEIMEVGDVLVVEFVVFHLSLFLSKIIL